jgi:ribosomal protein S18 acetylase RimI-like enzyme
MLIRRASTADAPVLWQAEVEVARTPGRLVSRVDELVLDAFAAKIRQLSAAGSYVVAEDGEKIVGHAFLERMPLAALKHVVHLTVVVHSGYSRRGIGTKLVRHLQDWTRGQRDIRKIELRVRSTNVAAVGLYGRLGFVEEGRFKDRVLLPDGQFVDDLAMAWFPAAMSGRGDR